MATGYDEHYARHLYNQYMEREIQRGISEFPTESINENSDAFLAWQLQNQEFEGKRESDCIPLALLSSGPSPGTLKDKNKEKKRNINAGGHGNITIIDSETECDTPNPVEHGKSEEEDKTPEENNSEREKNHTIKFQDRIVKEIRDSINSSKNTLTESGAVLAQPQSENRDPSQPLTFTFYSDDVEEDSVPEVSYFDEVIPSSMAPTNNSRKGMLAKKSFINHKRNDLYQNHKKPEDFNSSQRGKGSRQGRILTDHSSPSSSNDVDENSIPVINHLNNPNTSPIHPLNGFCGYPNPKVSNLKLRGKGSRRDRKFPNHDAPKQENESDQYTPPYDNNSISSEETLEKHFSNGSYKSKRKPKQRKKYFSHGENIDGGSDSATDDDERIACRLGQELNRTQCEMDREFAKRLQDEEKNNLLQANSMPTSRPKVQRNFPNLQMHDPYANRVIRHRTPFNLHEEPGRLHMLQTILGMEGQIMPPHLMQEGVDLNDYEALWDLAERLGEAKGSGLSKKDLKSLKTETFDSKSDENSDLTDCRICITDFVDGDVITSLPCKHRYHKRCIKTWLKRKAECPICRKNIKTKEKN